jgi:hypothetical protein
MNCLLKGPVSHNVRSPPTGRGLLKTRIAIAARRCIWQHRGGCRGPNGVDPQMQPF